MYVSRPAMLDLVCDTLLLSSSWIKISVVIFWGSLSGLLHTTVNVRDSSLSGMLSFRIVSGTSISWSDGRNTKLMELNVKSTSSVAVFDPGESWMEILRFYSDILEKSLWIRMKTSPLSSSNLYEDCTNPMAISIGVKLEKIYIKCIH